MTISRRYDFIHPAADAASDDPTNLHLLEVFRLGGCYGFELEEFDTIIELTVGESVTIAGCVIQRLENAS